MIENSLQNPGEVDTSQLHKKKETVKKEDIMKRNKSVPEKPIQAILNVNIVLIQVDLNGRLKLT